MPLRSSKLGLRWTNRSIDICTDQMRVLVVDDNHVAAEALEMVLALESIECRTAFGGFEAIPIAIAWMPHAIIMDISMPGGTGIEAALILRQDERTSAIAILAFTALDEAEVRRHLVGDEFDGSSASCRKVKEGLQNCCNRERRVLL